MKIADFFIDRPIFAAVVSIVITIIGALAFLKLPISEYPEVVPPTVVVRTTYPGANPTVIADTVASPLEQSITGVEVTPISGVTWLQPRSSLGTSPEPRTVTFQS